MTSSTAPTPYRLTGISPKAYEHPADRAATAALKQIPFIDVLVKKLFEFGFERSIKQDLLGNGIRLGPNQLPQLYQAYLSCLDTLDLPSVYELYLLQTPQVNAMAYGADRPIVILNSGLTSILDKDELKSVLAHEVGHILSEHVLYRTVLFLLLQISWNTLPLPPLSGLPLQAITLILLEWSRASELTCDRAAALVVRDPRIHCRTLMKLAGGNVEGLNVDAFIQQASQYESWDDYLDRGLRFFGEMGTTHPYAVRRVSELTRWIQAGDFDRIISGNYVRRGQEPPPTAEFERAVDFYASQFRHLISETGIGVQQLSRQISDWLRDLQRSASTRSERAR
ncbi:M48 family metallopeptidase [Gloeobacter kilaueensis]|uniref:Peptidase M48 Ste24p n=1 Tax=Gloeobacter kilaueensis (strain ATCC BAA-2537 / CCAP 1431/1 / ULC 316 / JS1) TaxID=1183438 RepID=U5QJ62_GLOK1|nr:M48 family metallopeptidase [Gloeobacter kilaueensis]AGY58951.1 peptidase M48 Ste24p [Gloeobacter kilaueensis JS1]